MHFYVAFLIGAMLLALMGVAGFILAGYKWGKFAALKALAQNSPKWQAYVLALLPPAAFAVTFLFDGQLDEFAAKAFVGLAAPAVVGACLRYNAGGHALL